MDKSTDILEMSDEDFSAMSPPVVTEAPASVPAVEAVEEQPIVEQSVETPVQTDQEQEVDQQQEAEQQPQEEQPVNQEPVVEKEPVVLQEEQPPVVEEFDYKSAYENLLSKPIRANGKDIKLKSVDELVQLAQMGANYTRKMQDIAPHRKTLMMLENNNIDQDQLSYLIDLSKKDPQAIQKLLKESGVNPLDIDVEAEPTYKGGNHRVSDAEAAFTTTLEDMQQSDSGKYVLQAIHGTWDQASKEQLVKQPNIMEIMREQHESGFYERISDEVDRQRALGAIPSSQSWLQSYKIIGDQMVAQGAFADLLANQTPAQQTPPVTAAPVATRVAAPKPAIVPNAKADAAAPTRATPKPAKTFVNPLNMRDDEFMKQFENRL